MPGRTPALDGSQQQDLRRASCETLVGVHGQVSALPLQRHSCLPDDCWSTVTLKPAVCDTRGPDESRPDTAADDSDDAQRARWLVLRLGRRARRRLASALRLAYSGCAQLLHSLSHAGIHGLTAVPPRLF
ncbi:hypothetical protein H4R21_002200 [Coemansia helicoidea]|uniref:Uncharacterized protein n=1 Tax=Coemansia helicoidea TaxID=1286919 RepID=A0ACC1L8I3_9FUNG|nr:hypothetical protein H4R21_002200 [Coemansia helicoidea]